MGAAPPVPVSQRSPEVSGQNHSPEAILPASPTPCALAPPPERDVGRAPPHLCQPAQTASLPGGPTHPQAWEKEAFKPSRRDTAPHSQGHLAREKKLCIT